MQMNVPKGRVNYEPNSLAVHDEEGGPRECPMSGFGTFQGRSEQQEQGDKLRVRAELFADHYSQARLFWRSQQLSEQAHIASSFVFELSKVGLAQVPTRMVGNLRNVDEELAKRVAAGLGIELPKKAPAARAPFDMEPSPALSIHVNMKATIEGRTIGILIEDGTDASALAKLTKAIQGAGARALLIAPKIGGTTLADGEIVKADGQLMGSPSRLFDAIAVLLSEGAIKTLINEGAAVQWVMDAFGHLKAIGYVSEAKELLDRAGIELDEGVVLIDDNFVQAAARRYWDREPKLRSLA